MKLSRIVEPLFLYLPTLYTIPCGFYRSPNTQNRMCELCTFSKSSHICHYTCLELANQTALIHGSNSNAKSDLKQIFSCCHSKGMTSVSWTGSNLRTKKSCVALPLLFFHIRTWSYYRNLCCYMPRFWAVLLDNVNKKAC